MSKKKCRIDLKRANLVGTIHSPGGFAAAKKFASLLDAAEVRVDCHPRPLALSDLTALTVPILLTVRRQDEGGARPLSESEREFLYHELLPAAAAVDVEVRSIERLRSVVETARKARVAVVASYHDFEATPTVRKMKSVAARARQAGADIVKIAARAETPSAVGRLLEALETVPGPLSIMAMGSLGRASRLLFAQSGSVLNYGWLDKPQVSGQWGAVEFRQLLQRLDEH